ncbi:MAG: hypothetical protein QOG72_797 [Sphingomonadales bacterium]|nr:hypothetical protein [Sphingomonadales bacterium]
MTIINKCTLLSRRSGSRADQDRARSPGTLLLSSALLLSACGASDATAKDPKEAVSSTNRAYSVAGIELGMTADQVKSAALKAGYRLSSETPGRDWALELESAASGPSPHFGNPLRGIRSQEFAKDGQMITVSYLAMPQRYVAWSVSYSAGPAIVSLDNAVNEMTKRYGKSSFANTAGHWAQWCSAGVRSPQQCLRQSFLSVNESPNGVSMHAENPGLRDEQKRLLLEHAGKKPSF